MHGRDDTHYGVAGGCTRSAADTLCYTAILILAIGGVVAVELITALCVGPQYRAAAAVSGTPVAVRPFATDTPSQSRPLSDEMAGGSLWNSAPGMWLPRPTPARAGAGRF